MSEVIKKLTKTEYSKRLNTWVLIVFAVLVLIAMVLIYFNPTIGGSIVGLVGVIMPIPSVSILAYSSKAKAENVLKIQNSNATNSEEGDA